MKTEWTREQCSVQPEQFAPLNDRTYIQRRNIVRAPEMEGVKDPGWVCESRKISADVYQEIMEQADLVQQVVLETTDTEKYKDGYDAAVVFLGAEEPAMTSRAMSLRPIIEKAAAVGLDDQEALEAVELFAAWSSESRDYQAGDRVRYGGTLYKCLQAHISQEAWTPTAAPSLWVRVDDPGEEWPEWIQPTGATEAYARGAKVSHDSKHWISNTENNVWEPGVYGWDEA